LQDGFAQLNRDSDASWARLGARDGLGVASSETASAPEVAPTNAAQTNPNPPRTFETIRLGEAAAHAKPSEQHHTDEPGDRPEIRLHGNSGGADSKRKHGNRTPARVIVDSDLDASGAASSTSSTGAPGEGDRAAVAAPSDERAPAVRVSALDPDAKKAYDRGLALVQSKQLDAGAEQLASFLVRWPDHPLAENALYWRGEAMFAKGEFTRAAEQFEAVIARSATGNKTPDALLKLGMCHQRLGAEDQAVVVWEKLRKDYPRSDAVNRLAGGRQERAPKRSKENR